MNVEGSSRRLSHVENRTARALLRRSANPDQAAHDLQLLQKAGLKEMRTLSSPLRAKRHVYRIVSRRFATYGEARLALHEARRVLAHAKIRFKGIILDVDRAGVPMIR